MHFACELFDRRQDNYWSTYDVWIQPFTTLPARPGLARPGPAQSIGARYSAPFSRSVSTRPRRNVTEVNCLYCVADRCCSKRLTEHRPEVCATLIAHAFVDDFRPSRFPWSLQSATESRARFAGESKSETDRLRCTARGQSAGRPVDPLLASNRLPSAPAGVLEEQSDFRNTCLLVGRWWLVLQWRADWSRWSLIGWGALRNWWMMGAAITERVNWTINSIDR